MTPERLREMLQETAGRSRFGRLLLEKDYFITRFLDSAGRVFGRRMIVKGGTLLAKAYLDYRRLSEDIDYALNIPTAELNRARRSKLMDPVRDQMEAVATAGGLRLRSTRGRGFNSSTQYLFEAAYTSALDGHEESMKIEVSVRHPLRDAPVELMANHLFQDAVTGKDLIPRPRIWCLSRREAVAEKLRAALTRREPAIRDYYDLAALLGTGFDFADPQFLAVAAAKLREEEPIRNLSRNLGLSDPEVVVLSKQVETDLRPLLRTGDAFDFQATLARLTPVAARVYSMVRP